MRIQTDLKAELDLIQETDISKIDNLSELTELILINGKMWKDSKLINHFIGFIRFFLHFMN